MTRVNKDFKKFIFLLIASIILAFVVSYSYSAYQNYQQEKKINEIKKIFNFQENNKKIKKNIASQEIWQNERLEALKTLGYKKIDIRPFYKRLYDKITGKKVYTYKNINDESKIVIVEINGNKILEDFFDGNKKIISQELTSNEDFTSYDLKSYDLDTMEVTTFKDVLNIDTYLNTKNGIVESKDGKRIEFTHKNGEMNGPAVENFPNGNKIEFNFVNNKRLGKAEKFYKNGDREIFIYGKNNLKNGESIYYFGNGDIEKTTYMNGVLEGKAQYIYSDGIVEYYEYKDGKRIEN